MDKKETGVDVNTINDYYNQFKLLMDVTQKNNGEEIELKPSAIS